MSGLDGEWRVERRGGLLPPLLGIRKRIRGSRGETRIRPLPGLPFRVEGLELRYLGPFSAFVDVLEPVEDGYLGHATFRGREYAQFALRPVR